MSWLTDKYNEVKSGWGNIGSNIANGIGYMTDPSSELRRSGIEIDSPNIKGYGNTYKMPTPGVNLNQTQYGGAQAPVYIPSINLSSIYGQAQQKGQQVADNYYNTIMQQYAQKRDLNKQSALNEYQNMINKAQQDLDKTIQGTGVARERTTEDVTRTLGEIQTDETGRQVSESRQFDTGLRGLRENVAESGLTGSGLGKQAVLNARTERKESEQAQAMSVERAKETQNLMKTRTFEDLANTDDWARKAHTETGRYAEDKKSYDMSWADLEYQINQTRAEGERIENKANAESGFLSNYYKNYLSGLKGSGQQARANEIYGSFFR
jgi:hypothetical protein